MYDIQHCFICRPTDSTVSEDAGIEPRTVATTALTVRCSNHSAKSHPQYIIVEISKAGAEAFSPQKHPSLQNMKILYFYIFVGHFCPPGWIRIQIRIQNVDPYPDPATQINADLMRIRIHNLGFGSGFIESG
jgi:hypothetical protein